jgi:hypothetical protein
MDSDDRTARVEGKPLSDHCNRPGRVKGSLSKMMENISTGIEKMEQEGETFLCNK